uniref:Uncharacterized protein n=1 Tax=Glossina brevipalpis TaxID=37001 RepID=A0A1A9WM19_9MUSC
MQMDVHLTHWSLFFVILSCFLFYVFASESAKYVTNQAASAINNEAADALRAVVDNTNEIVADVLNREGEVPIEEFSNQKTMPNLEEINKFSQPSIPISEPSITSSPLKEWENSPGPVKVSIDALPSDSANKNNVKNSKTNNDEIDAPLNNADKLRTTNIDEQGNESEDKKLAELRTHVHDNVEKVCEENMHNKRALMYSKPNQET